MSHALVGGVSIGGIETCIDVPAWKLAFDIGRCPREIVARPTILFTHAHMDHMGGVAWHAATRALQGMAPPTYVVPRPNAAALDELFEVWRRLDGSELPYVLVPVEPGEEHVLPNGIVARPFLSIHRVYCQGYALWSRRKRLKAEFRGLSNERIRHLRVVDGVDVEELVETPELAFTGDTRIEVVELEEVVRRARTLVLEVTFVDERVSVKQCRSKGHTHLFEVAERAELFENERLVFSHFSARYSNAEILRALDERLPASLRERVVPLLPPE